MPSKHVLIDVISGYIENGGSLEALDNATSEKVRWNILFVSLSHDQARTIPVYCGDPVSKPVVNDKPLVRSYLRKLVTSSAAAIT